MRGGRVVRRRQCQWACGEAWLVVHTRGFGDTEALGSNRYPNPNPNPNPNPTPNPNPNP